MSSAVVTSAARRWNLPIPLNPLIGRSRETSAAAALLLHPAIRPGTLTGPGGVGKTRLALHGATEVADAFSDVWFIPLDQEDRYTPDANTRQGPLEVGGCDDDARCSEAVGGESGPSDDQPMGACQPLDAPGSVVSDGPGGRPAGHATGDPRCRAACSGLDAGRARGLTCGADTRS